MSEDRVSRAIAARLGSRVARGTRSLGKRGRPVKTGIGVLDCSNSDVKAGDLVEVVGVTSAGKTQLLHAIASRALSSSESTGKPEVCWFDLNGGLDIERLRRMIQTSKRSVHGIDVDLEPDNLSALLVYHPETTLALCSSLHALLSFLETAEGANGLLMHEAEF